MSRLLSSGGDLSNSAGLKGREARWSVVSPSRGESPDRVGDCSALTATARETAKTGKKQSNELKQKQTSQRTVGEEGIVGRKKGGRKGVIGGRPRHKLTMFVILMRAIDWPILGFHRLYF